MTWPSEIKPAEGERPGTTFEQFEVGASLPEVRFTVTPEVIKTYEKAVDADPGGFSVGGRRAALPSVLSVYLMAVLYRRYPPAQGGVMARNRFDFHHPLWADQDTEIVASGRVEDKFEKRGRRYVQYSATFSTADGTLIAEAANTSTFPV